ncbi:YtxH domain-containing protein [Petrachloros mirabilis]
MSDQGKQAAKFAAMVAGGAVVGAGLGLLFAPKAGTETRRDIARYAKKTQIHATRWGRAIQSGVKEVVERGKEAVQKPEQQQRIEAA